MVVRQLTPEERFDAALISTVAFHGKIDDLEKKREETRRETVEDWGAFSDEGKMMARIINNRYTVFLDGHEVQCGGIGAVSTLPEYREEGAIRAIFRDLLSQARKNGEILSALYPFNHAFYRKFGYETVCWCNQYEFAPTVLKGYTFAGKSRLWKTGDPVREWTELYSRFTADYNLAIARDDKRMEGHLKGEYYKDRKFCYMLYAEDRPLAYLIFQDIRHDPAAILDVMDLAWDGAEGFRAILGFLARFSADYGTIRLFLPRDIELLNLIRSPQAYDIQKTSHQNYMIRVVNAVKALEAMRKPADCSFVIRVSDDLVTENNGTWKVTREGVEPTEEEPDLSVSERALGQLIAGAVSLREALCREDTVVYGNRETLERVFIRKPILVEDHF